jgi:hypothetical protein
MGRRASFGALVLVAALTAPSIAMAQMQTLATFGIENWTGNAFARHGRFSHCAASRSYGSRMLVFDVDRQNRWSLSVINPEWRLPRDTVLTVGFSIDDGPTTQTSGMATKATSVDIPLVESMDWVNRFRRGQVLKVALGGGVISFDLKGASAILTQLFGCAREYGEPVAAAPQPSGGKRPTAPNTRTTLGNPAFQAEAAVLLANVMSAANVSGYSMATPEEARKRSAHAAWSAPSVVGSLLIIPARRVDDPEIRGLVTGINATGCKGAFMSASLPSDGRVVRVTTTCQLQGQPLRTSYYFGIPRPRGGLYLFITDTTRDGGREDVERADEMIRQASLRTVN